MANHACRPAPAPIRQRADRCVVIPQIRVPSKYAMLLPKIAIDPGVELILIVRLLGSSHKVTRSPDVRRWIVLQNLFGDGVEAIGGNGVVLELRAGRARGIENRLREDALPLRQRGHHAKARYTGSQPRPLPVGEEECLV